MTNIWSFILQTIEASLIAAVILIVWLLLKNNLSPSLRYSLWFLLAIRILSPAGILYRYMIPKLAIALDAAKSITEAALSSNYISQYSSINAAYPVPWISKAPSSITDWIFVIYVSGALLFFIIYTILTLRKIKSITSTSSKIAYLVQRLFWSMLRSLNWCNPLLQYVFNIVLKDMDCIYKSNKPVKIDKVQGVPLLYICMSVTILIPSIFGISFSRLYDAKSGKYGLEKAYASARISRCTTVAGAIDTYAKAIMYYNKIYMLAVTPLDKQKEIIEDIIDPLTYDMSGVYPQYEVYNLQKNTDETYSALIVFYSKKLLNKSGGYYTFTGTDGNTYEHDGYYIHPVTIKKDNGWVISSAGERQVVINNYIQPVEGTLSNIPYMNKLYGKCNTGEITIEERSVYKVNNALENNGPFGNMFGTSYDRTAKLDARFDSVDINVMYSYKYTGTEDDKNTIRSAGIAIMEVSDETRNMKFEDGYMSGDMSRVSGYEYRTNMMTSVSWDGSIRGGGGTSKDLNDKNIFPGSYKARVYWNGEPIDTVEITRGDNK